MKEGSLGLVVRFYLQIGVRAGERAGRGVSLWFELCFPVMTAGRREMTGVKRFTDSHFRDEDELGSK